MTSTESRRLNKDLGGKAGGSSLERNLYALMQERFGDAFKSLPQCDIGPSGAFLKGFEVTKRNFDGKDDGPEEFELPLKMKMLDRSNDDMHKYYNFDEDVVKISWYVVAIGGLGEICLASWNSLLTNR